MTWKVEEDNNELFLSLLGKWNLPFSLLVPVLTDLAKQQGLRSVSVGYFFRTDSEYLCVKITYRLASVVDIYDTFVLFAIFTCVPCLSHFLSQTIERGHKFVCPRSIV